VGARELSRDLARCARLGRRGREARRGQREARRGQREARRERRRDAAEAFAAALLLVATMPLAAIAAVAVRATSPGPVLFRQRRIGRDGVEFMIYKLRTMHVDAESRSGPVLARDGDERVTRVGRLLRATRLDELPQLVNVLNGDMRIIGPRPERPELAAAFVRRIPRYAERWRVKPGITGLAQVRADYHTPAAVKLEHDLEYLGRRSWRLDLRILGGTVRTVLSGNGV
jgi:lipopolysaccharide/colanic/teichoic acid biosynthesis glycosyltransferase